MYHHAFSLKFHSFSPHYALSLSNFSTQSPNPLLPPFARVPHVTSSVCLRCRSSAADVSPVIYADGSSSICSLGETGDVAVVEKPIDVSTLGNLCVDIVLSVHELPPPSRGERKALMDELSMSPPDKVWVLNLDFNCFLVFQW